MWELWEEVPPCMPGLDHMLHYFPPWANAIFISSQNHGCSECSEHSRALSSSTWLDPCLSKDSAEKASLLPPHTHTHTLYPHTLCPSGCSSIYFFHLLFLPPHRIRPHQDSSQILRQWPCFLVCSCQDKRHAFSNNSSLPLPVCFVSTFEKAPEASQSQSPAFTTFC